LCEPSIIIVVEITQAEIERICELARLRFESLERFREEFQRIVRFVEAVQELQTDGIEPLYYPGNAKCPEREDVCVNSLSHQEALQNAPKRVEEFFAVPRLF